jgi:predicted histone-like DNA-binding protein
MSIKIKAIAKGQPGVAGGGDKKYYASPVMDGEMDIEALTKAIEKICTVSGADIRAVLYALVDVSIDGLSRGAIIRMGDLGSLRITLSSEGKLTVEEVTAASVKKAGIIFTPGARLKEMLRNLKFLKA